VHEKAQQYPEAIPQKGFHQDEQKLHQPNSKLEQIAN
jgi:hypothetical protein